jgi:RluA family pseudouridine synthase
VWLGQVVTIAEALETPPAIVVLTDQDGLVAVDKPAGIPTIPDHAGAAHSLVAAVAGTLGCAPQELHPTSRLDRGVSGVVVFARTLEARDRLALARERGTYLRRYVAIAGRSPERPQGTWDAPIGRAQDPRRRAAYGRDATVARSRYEVVARAGERALLALEPETGRTHQLRVHAAHARAPLLGDRDYGGERRVTLASGRVIAMRRVALHAARVVVPRPSGEPFEVVARVPDELREVWTALGGHDDAWLIAAHGPMNACAASK